MTNGDIMFMVRSSPESFMSWSSSAREGENETLSTSTSERPIFSNQLFGLGVLAAVVALFADQQQNAAILLGLSFQQIDGIAHRIQNRSAAVARLADA